VIYFSKDSALRPGKSVALDLVDETEEGYYVVSKGERTAVYVPRSTVSLILYADNAQDSGLLRDSNKP
jgi:beta-lactamase class D